MFEGFGLAVGFAWMHVQAGDGELVLMINRDLGGFVRDSGILQNDSVPQEFLDGRIERAVALDAQVLAHGCCLQNSGVNCCSFRVCIETTLPFHVQLPMSGKYPCSHTVKP